MQSRARECWISWCIQTLAPRESGTHANRTTTWQCAQLVNLHLLPLKPLVKGTFMSSFSWFFSIQRRKATERNNNPHNTPAEVVRDAQAAMNDDMERDACESERGIFSGEAKLEPSVQQAQAELAPLEPFPGNVSLKSNQNRNRVGNLHHRAPIKRPLEWRQNWDCISKRNLAEIDGTLNVLHYQWGSPKASHINASQPHFPHFVAFLCPRFPRFPLFCSVESPQTLCLWG